MQNVMKRCQREWERAWNDPPHHQARAAAITASFVRTQLLTIAPTALQNGVRVRRPASGGLTVPGGFNYNSVQVDINLTDADKRLVGSTLALEVYFSFDAGATWNFIAGYPDPQVWRSYGPDGLIIRDPDGTITVDPDPVIYVALNGVTGQLVHIEYIANGLSTAGLTLFGIT